MKAYKDMTREELFAEKEKLEAMYQDYKGQNLALNMSRGKPSASQLDLSKGMIPLVVCRVSNPWCAGRIHVA